MILHDRQESHENNLMRIIIYWRELHNYSFFIINIVGFHGFTGFEDSHLLTDSWLGVVAGDVVPPDPVVVDVVEHCQTFACGFRLRSTRKRSAGVGPVAGHSRDDLLRTAVLPEQGAAITIQAYDQYYYYHQWISPTHSFGRGYLTRSPKQSTLTVWSNKLVAI